MQKAFSDEEKFFKVSDGIRVNAGSHDHRIPHGQYRIPSLVSTKNGTLIAFVAARLHCTGLRLNYLQVPTDLSTE